ncbi:MAG: hypothetical protein MRK00_04295 [Nitrosomonas sp.]|nr:hypothetical protein [Nitrosomonas sp.]
MAENYPGIHVYDVSTFHSLTAISASILNPKQREIRKTGAACRYFPEHLMTCLTGFWLFSTVDSIKNSIGIFLPVFLG